VLAGGLGGPRIGGGGAGGQEGLARVRPLLGGLCRCPPDDTDVEGVRTSSVQAGSSAAGLGLVAEALAARRAPGARSISSKLRACGGSPLSMSTRSWVEEWWLEPAQGKVWALPDRRLGPVLGTELVSWRSTATARAGGGLHPRLEVVGGSVFLVVRGGGGPRHGVSFGKLLR
jgi:hypothetical protein